MMKDILRKGIKKIRSFLDRAEASLEPEKMPLPKYKDFFAEKNVPKEDVLILSTTPEQDNLLVPFVQKKLDNLPSTYKDRKALNALLGEWVLVSGIEIKQAKATLRKHAQVQRIDYMTIGQVDEACEWLKKQIASIPKQQKL